jgi:CRISPR-associated protein Csc2
MTDLKQLEQSKFFLAQIAALPQGRYAHFVLLRETESFPVFQTDGTLNVIRVRAGLQQEKVISRLVMFKRKQSSPERLTGRELLRSVGIIADDGDKACEYNSADFCKHCPDCIHYGYAIGDAGAEKSKVLTDSAFSVTAYEDSHKAFSFNGLGEEGTMWDKKENKTRSAFGEQDHIVPQVFFPAVETLRDPTYEGFLYVLGNLLRTDRYGAQETRTGKVYNHLVAVVFSDGEIFSNLRFSQAVFDQFGENFTLPLDPQAVFDAAEKAFGTLIKQEPVHCEAKIAGDDLAVLVEDVTKLYQDKVRLTAILRALDDKTRAYAGKYSKPTKEKKAK